MGLAISEKVLGLVTAVNDVKSSSESLVGRCVEQIQGHVEEACATRESNCGTPEKKRYPRPERFRWVLLRDVFLVVGGDGEGGGGSRWPWLLVLFSYYYELVW